MVDRPIIFSAPMVLVLLEGRKTMTRRLAWSESGAVSVDYGKRLAAKGWRIDGRDSRHSYAWRPSPWQSVNVGDRIWVRENFSYQEFDGDRIEEFGGIHYWADGNPNFGNWTRPKPSIHMPRWASRLTLIVTATKAELLQDISDIDVLAEGFKRKDGLQGVDVEEVHRDAGRDWFSDLWTDLHGVDSWRANPEVIALSFRVEKINIDAMEARAA